jgi:hypothetical protein
LDLFCKSYEINKKTEKEKKKEQKKGRGKPFGPATELAHGPTPSVSESVPSPSPLLADERGLPVNISYKLGQESGVSTATPTAARSDAHPKP